MKLVDAVNHLVFYQFDWQACFPDADGVLIASLQNTACTLLRQAYEEEETKRVGCLTARYCGCSGLMELTYESEHCSAVVDEEGTDAAS